MDDLLRVSADTSSNEPVLVCELEHAFDGRSAVDGRVALREHRHNLLVVGDGRADVFK